MESEPDVFYNNKNLLYSIYIFEDCANPNIGSPPTHTHTHQKKEKE